MALTIISTNTVNAGTGFTFAATGDDLYLMSNVLLASTGGNGIVADFSDTNTRIDGTLVGQSVAYYAINANSRLSIGATGSIVAYESESSNAGIIMFSERSGLVNHGQILAHESIAFYAGGSEADLVNSGRIDGTTGIQIATGSSDSTLVNHGHIFGSGFFDNSQEVWEGRGVLVQGANAHIFNGATGVIGSTALTGTGIYATSFASGLLIENLGTITAQHGHGIDLSTMNPGASMIEVLNSGLISGQTASFLGSVNVDKVVNSGQMTGDVGMAGGFDTLDNRQGTILGDVDMGQGDDQVLNRGGSVLGLIDLGDGQDTLDTRGGTVLGDILGGLGDDRFMLNAAEGETVDGGDGTDTVDYRSGPAVTLALDGSLAMLGAAAGDVLNGIERVMGSAGGDDVIRGDDQVNFLWGNGGDDQLDGAAGVDTLQGGLGDDLLTGGLGNDTFRYLSLAEAGDTITDFGNVAASNDRFQLAVAGFGGGLVAGALAAADFRSRADNLAQDASDRFIFRTTDRTLWFDVDGNGTEAAVMLADLQAGAVVVAGDILLF